MNLINKPDMTELNQITNLLFKCRDHMINQGIDQWDEHYPNAEIVTKDIENKSIYSYREGQTIRGVISLYDTQPQEYENIDWKTQGEDRALVIYRLAVDPDWQGKGIARKLVDFAESYASQNNYASIRLDCYSKNERAFNLYQHLNYDVRGEVIFEHSNIPFYCLEKELEHLSI